jgi:glycosyltransferase involved in cell wall biosynthesis
VKIAHIITGLEADGAETMLYKLLQYMNRSNFDPIVASLVDDGPLAVRIQELGVPVINCGMRPGFPNVAATLRLARVLRRFGPTLLQGWMYHGNLAAQVVAAALPGKTPVIWNIRGAHHILRDEKFMTAATIWLGARLSALPCRIISNSLASARLHERYLRFSRDRWLIIPNGFDLEMFAPSEDARAGLRCELGLAPDTLLIGLMGRYHPMKDHANFLRAAALFREKFPGIHFVLAGSGVDNRNGVLRGQLKSLQLAECTHLLGERKDMPRITAGLDIAGSASYSEAFPNVIGEAMSCGVPCVVTDVGDSAFLVGKTGLSVPPRDSAALAKAWMELAAGGSLLRRALGAAARERIATHFSMGSIAAQYEQTYYEVTGQRPEPKGYRPCAA